MEIDIKLREFLVNDKEINKYEYNLLLESYACKINNCYDKKNYKKELINNLDYQNCIETCSNEFKSFYKFKQEFYKRTMEIIYKKESKDFDVINKFEVEFPAIKNNFYKMLYN